MQAGTLEWASAVGNQAVQRLARQHEDSEPVEEAEPPAEEPEPEEALAPAEAEGLAAVDDDAETLPE